MGIGMLFKPEGESKVQMSVWSVREVSIPLLEDATRHLVGVVDGLGRVCSPIHHFDRETMTVRTRSGKLYKLVGEPGGDADAEYVWNKWCEMNQITDSTDVTEEYWNDAP